MKKWIIVLTLLLLLAIISIYAFVPGATQITRSVTINASANNIHRYLTDKNKWIKWWPGTGANEQYSYKGNDYSIQQKHHRAIEVNIGHSGNSHASNIIITPIRADSVEISWHATISGTLHPLKRLFRSRKSRELNRDIGEILQSLQKFLADEKNIYGINVQLKTVKDTLLITAKQFFNVEPDNEGIYTIIRNLQGYIALQGGKETGFPMKHSRVVDGNFELMVAIPINTELKHHPYFTYKRMIPLKILVTEVQGGPYIVKHAFRQLENYVQDHRYESPAIPFESLVTDRLIEQDSSKWITRIYYPVF